MRHRRLVVGGVVAIALFCVVAIPLIVIFGRAKHSAPAAHLQAATL
jgi:hypothetical protein